MIQLIWGVVAAPIFKKLNIMIKAKTRRNKTIAKYKYQKGKLPYKRRVLQLISRSNIDINRVKSTSQETEFKIAITRLILDEYGKFSGIVTDLGKRFNRDHSAVSYYIKFANSDLDNNIKKKIKLIK